MESYISKGIYWKVINTCKCNSVIHVCKGYNKNMSSTYMVTPNRTRSVHLLHVLHVYGVLPPQRGTVFILWVIN